ncbi:MAG: hypothetical protein IJ565_00545 [Bacilli bacterium]|nr:hypothetical protein [Bacilli bacterium]
MKKYFSLFLILLVCTFIVPLTVNAENGTPVAETLEEAMTQEGIEYDHSDYKQSNDKPTIYLFRGHGCSHCYELLTFFDEIVDDYGKYFNFKAYEVWYDADNSNLMQEVASVFGEAADGVPYLVIGDQTFLGYNPTTDDTKIKKALENYYNSKDKYDVMDHLGETTNTSKSTGVTSSAVIYTMVIMTFVIIAVYYVKSNNDMVKLQNQIAELKDEIKKNQSTTKETKITEKKVTTKKKN